MANVTVRFGALLIFLGLVFFYITGMHAYTSLIATLFGVLLVVLGLLARTNEVKMRMLYMHIAVTVGLIGFLFPAFRAGKSLFERYVNDLPILHLRAVQEEGLMAVICLLYVGLCVRSFIAVRRSRA